MSKFTKFREIICQNRLVWVEDKAWNQLMKKTSKSRFLYYHIYLMNAKYGKAVMWNILHLGYKNKSIILTQQIKNHFRSTFFLDVMFYCSFTKGISRFYKYINKLYLASVTFKNQIEVSGYQWMSHWTNSFLRKVWQRQPIPLPSMFIII